MNGRDFLSFAKNIIGYAEEENLNNIKQLDEVVIRNAISRAYYCVYHESKRLLISFLNIDVDKASGGTHERIVQLMVVDKNPRVRGLGFRMRQFHARRVKADYKLDSDIELTAAIESIIECEKILDIIDSLI